MDEGAVTYPRGKSEILLRSIELTKGGMVSLNSHLIQLLGNVEQGKIVFKRKGMEDLTYLAGDSFVFATIGAKGVPILSCNRITLHFISVSKVIPIATKE